MIFCESIGGGAEHILAEVHVERPGLSLEPLTDARCEQRRDCIEIGHAHRCGYDSRISNRFCDYSLLARMHGFEAADSQIADTPRVCVQQAKWVAAVPVELFHE